MPGTGVEIDKLEISVESRSETASKGIDSLSTSLGRLKAATKGGAGLGTVANRLASFNTALSQVNVESKKISQVTKALNSLGSVQKASGFISTVNSLKKLPDVTKNLGAMNLDKFAAQMERVATSVRPLAVEMEKVSKGFAAFPAKIKRLITESGKMELSNGKLSRSYKTLGGSIAAAAGKLSLILVAAKRVARYIGSWINESNDYVENLNLFTVAMGEFAGEAQKYAEKVSDIMGIDPSEWMRNQGIFMTLASGFGVATDRAAQMSRTLTQLGYDLSSFFNISYEDSMQKLQSGLSGELEPLRRLGYDLSQARLEAIALSLGIDQSVSSMTQAEKAQLRYVAIMTQVTKSQGDMSRTLQAPANQLRIFNAQITQTARALGNIFIPMVNAVLPVMIALAKVVRLAAEAIASLFGFELPTIDYSGLDGIGVSAGTAADELEDANGSAQKLKRSLLGFDELNVLPAAENGGGSGIDVGGVGGFDFDLGQYDYDFIGDAVNDKVEKIVETIKGVGSALAPLGNVIGGIIKTLWPTLKNIAAVIAVTKIAKWIAKLKLIRPVASTISNLFTAFWIGLKEGNGLIGKLSAGATLARQEMGILGGRIGKTAGILGGFAVTALTTMDAVKGLLTGTMGLDQALINIGISAGGTALMLGSMFGAQVGIATAAVGLLVGGLSGLAAAYVQNNTLTGEAKAVLDQYVSGINGTAEALGMYAEDALAAVEEMAPLRESISETSGNIASMIGQWQLAGTATSEAISSMLNDIKTLESDAQTYLNGLFNSINIYIAGAFVNASGESRDAMLEITKNVALIQADGNEAVANASIRLQEILKQSAAAGGELTDAMSAEMMELLDVLGAGTHDFGLNMSEIESTIANIDLSKGVFSVADAMKQISTVIDEQKRKNQEFVDTFDFGAIEKTAGPAAAAQLREYLNYVLTEYNTQFDEVLNNSASTIIDNYAKNLGEIEGVTGQEFELAMLSLQAQIGATGVRLPKALFDGYIEGFREKLGTVDETSKEFAGNLDDSMRDALEINSPAKIAYPWGESVIEGLGVGMTRDTTTVQNAADNVVSMLESAFSKAPAKFLAIGQGIPDAIARGIMLGGVSLGAMAVNLATTLYTSFENASGTKYVTFGKSIPTAIGLGMSTGKSNAIGAAKNLITEMQNAMTGSVSAFSGIGTKIANEIVKGFNSNTIGSSAGKMLNAILTKFETFYLRVRSNINSLVSSIGKAFSTFNITTSGVTFTKIPYVSIPRFETGGFPDAGQLFMARESGPELVGTMGGNTAVANNQQIIQGIEQGVYRAVTSAMGSGGDVVVNGEVDGDKLLSVIIKKAQQQQRRTGVNPLTTMIG